MRAGLDVRVDHPIALLDMAYRNGNSSGSITEMNEGVPSTRREK